MTTNTNIQNINEIATLNLKQLRMYAEAEIEILNQDMEGAKFETQRELAAEKVGYRRALQHVLNVIQAADPELVKDLNNI